MAKISSVCFILLYIFIKTHARKTCLDLTGITSWDLKCKVDIAASGHKDKHSNATSPGVPDAAPLFPAPGLHALQTGGGSALLLLSAELRVFCQHFVASFDCLVSFESMSVNYETFFGSDLQKPLGSGAVSIFD